MARANWKGSINFGLVNIPVALQPATTDKDVHFHMLHDKDGGRIREKKFCEQDGKEVSWDHIVKGYAISKHQYVTMTKDELKAADPERDRTVRIEGFVKLEEIDPVYFEKSYHVLADGKSTKAYALLAGAMSEAGRVAIGRVVISTKEHLCAIRAQDGVLRMNTLFFGDEIVEAPAAEKGRPTAKELKMAQTLIEQMEMPFEPEKLKDTHRERVLELIEQKAKGETIEAPRPAPMEKITDLAAALEKSLAAVKSGKTSPPAARPHHRVRTGSHPRASRARSRRS
jgi:DNA end-binding protein Ku